MGFFEFSILLRSVW